MDFNGHYEYKALVKGANKTIIKEQYKVQTGVLRTWKLESMKSLNLAQLCRQHFGI